jgi:oligopeptide/dipeptide ABC transporter ATP-binding protein
MNGTADRKVLIEVRNLTTTFRTEAGIATAIEDISFSIYEGEVLGIVGESGSGKSVTALSMIRLIPCPPGEISSGKVIFKGGKNLLDLEYTDMYHYRGNEIAMIFQEPMTSLNPVFTIGYQVIEVIRQHQKVSREEARQRAIQVLDDVGIPDAEKRLWDYPHQFSGGMRQRAMIAIALACNPALLIADEPTTALDVTIQAQILDLMMEKKAQREEAAIMLITHDLAVVAETCERVIVMYGGRIQEVAEIHELFDNPLHPYTLGLLKSLPGQETKGQKLYTIPGIVPSILDLPKGCKFCTRCPMKMDICEKVEPELIEVSTGHNVRCHLMDKEDKS